MINITNSQARPESRVNEWKSINAHIKKYEPISFERKYVGKENFIKENITKFSSIKLLEEKELNAKSKECLEGILSQLEGKEIINVSIEDKEDRDIERLSKIHYSQKNESYLTFCKKWEKKERCNVKEILNQYGNLYVLDNENSNLLSCKIKMINFPIKKELFDKGKELDSEHYTQYKNSNNIPDIKFWNQRYYYFSRFNEGIQMDYESWYSVTPEELAIYIAKLCGPNAVVVDAFCGPGGNVIQYSKYCKTVYAIDIDPVKIQICKNNAKVYKCADNIKFILSDFMEMEGKIKVIFY